MLSSPTPCPSSSNFDFFSPSKSSNSVASSSANVIVKTRITRKPIHSNRPAFYNPLSLSLSPRSSPTSPKKRSSPSQESLSPISRNVKRLRSSVSSQDGLRKRPSKSSLKIPSRAPSCQQTLQPSPEPIYRTSRSRSTSAFHSYEDDVPVMSQRWMTDEDGRVAPPSHLSCEAVVKKLMKSYKPFFKNLDNPEDFSFKPHPKHYPFVELEYPNTYSSERFVLLAPKDKDHYNPIMDLEKSLYTIIEYYLTPQQQALFGSIPNEFLSEAPSPPASPSPTSSRPSSSASTSSLSSLSDSSSLSSLTSSSNDDAPRIPLLRAVQRAIHTQNGPLFLKTMGQINNLLCKFKYPRVPDDLFSPRPANTLKEAVASWTDTGIPKKVLLRIIEENYQRSVGPNVPKLRRYEAFSSTVYGELMPSLVYEMIQITKLNENSLFLDLGSGVGNVVVQASLQAGCTSYGIELLPEPANVARNMLEHLRVRCRMWGVRFGEVELEEGNMLESRRVDELIPKADVVLVDNKVFEESLNEALRPKFLDLKEGAIVISLKPFVSSLNARVTERNVDDISTIFDVTERPYYPGSVSWGNNGGTYYLHRVDRTGYADILRRFENSRTGSLGRSTKTRR